MELTADLPSGAGPAGLAASAPGPARASVATRAGGVPLRPGARRHPRRPAVPRVDQPHLAARRGRRARTSARQRGRLLAAAARRRASRSSLAHAEGYAEVWVGTVDGPRIDLRDRRRRPDARRAKEYTAGHRLYGLVEGDLAWAYDVAARGEPLQAACPPGSSGSRERRPLARPTPRSRRAARRTSCTTAATG